MRVTATLLLGFCTLLLFAACSDGKATPTPTATSSPIPAAAIPAVVRGALLTKADLPAGWVIETTMENAPTVGCSGVPTAAKFGAGRVLRDDPSQNQFVIQAIAVLPAGGAEQFMAAIPCRTDATFKQLPIPDDPSRVVAFRKTFDTQSNYNLTIVFIRRGDVVSYFSLQELATADHAEELARVADNRLAALETALLHVR